VNKVIEIIKRLFGCIIPEVKMAKRSEERLYKPEGNPFVAIGHRLQESFLQ